MHEVPHFSTPSWTFIICRYFNDSHSDRCEVISHYCSHLHFSNISNVEHFFICLLAISMSSFEKCLFRSCVRFFIGLTVHLILSCMTYLYILEINPLLVTSFANIFSHSAGCLFAFIYFTLGDIKNILLWFMSKCVLPMLLSSRSFMVSGLTFMSLNHFEFIFVYGVNECSNLIDFHVAFQFSQHQFLKRLSFLNCIFLPLCHRLIGHRCTGLLLGYFVPLIYVSVLVQVPWRLISIAL